MSCKKNRCSKLDQVKWIFLVYFSLSKTPPPPFVNDTSNGFAYLRTVPLKNDFYCTFNFASALKVLVYWDFLILFKGISEYRLSLGPAIVTDSLWVFKTLAHVHKQPNTTRLQKEIWLEPVTIYFPTHLNIIIQLNCYNHAFSFNVV